MAEATLSTPANAAAKQGPKRLVAILGMGMLLASGFGSTFFGFWSPLSFLPNEETPAEIAPAVDFVALPQIVLTLPGPQMRNLVMSVQIETRPAKRPEVLRFLPRLSDSFNTFLAGIDISAFEKRGILEIVRDELATRAVYVLGKDVFTDILITEFRIQ